MTPDYTIEHYLVCGLPVAVVKTAKNRVMQAWAADKDKHCLVRDARLISDVETDSRVRSMTKMAFDAYCAQHFIETSIPERAIRQTMDLISYTEPANDTRSSFNGFRARRLAIN